MINHKFTDEQIIRCLNECDGKENIVAHIVDQGKETFVTLGRILEIINRQKVEIESLEIANETEYTANNKQEAEIERLQSRNNFLEIEYKNQGNLFWSRVKGAQAESITEFADKLKAISQDYGHGNAVLVTRFQIEQLVKEMTEENEKT